MGLNNRIYLVLPPNIMRRAREAITARFPDAELDAPDIHSEMFAFASNFGQGPIPALTVSAYPQIVLHAEQLADQGRLGAFSPDLPPLRKEFVDLGMTPPLEALRIVSVVPGVMAASSSLVHPLEDWIDLCDPDFPGPVGCPPEDTPLPYLAREMFTAIAGDAAGNLLAKLDTRSNPIDINKRIASGDLPASLIIPAFARTFRGGNGRMIWPRSGAAAIPLMACLSADAAPVAREIMAFLLSDEVQGEMVRDAAIAPVVPGIAGFEELEENSWNCFWPGWNCMRSVARTMCAADITP